MLPVRLREEIYYLIYSEREANPREVTKGVFQKIEFLEQVACNLYASSMNESVSPVIANDNKE